MSLSVSTVERLWVALNSRPAPVLLLGAGASAKSGIPMAGELVEQAAKWAYCHSVGRNPNDLTVRRSDWLPWLERHSWYRKAEGPSENYSQTVEYLLQPRENRKAFFIKITDPGVPASTGYERVADMMADGLVHTVLTTNFDSVLPDLCRQRRRPHYVEVIKTPHDYMQFTAAPAHPQIVYLHGSFEHYTDKNLLEEVQVLDQALVELLTPLLRDHPVIVIGYRGGEPSIMRHLLMEQANTTNNFRHGIYWSMMRGRVSYVAPMVRELGNMIGGNLQLVERALGNWRGDGSMKGPIAGALSRE